MYRARIPQGAHRAFVRGSRNNSNTKVDLTYRRVKRALTKDTFTTKVFAFITIASGVSSLVFYWRENQNTPQNKLKRALEYLREDDADIKKEGFHQLEDAVHIKKRTFSGPVELVVDPEAIASPELVEVLLKNATTSDSVVSEEALTWLVRLTSSSVASSDTVRALILANDPDLQNLASLLGSRDYGTDDVWINASHLLLNFPKEELYSHVMNREVLGHKLTDMVESANPAAVALAAQLYENFLFDVALEPAVAAPLRSLLTSRREHPQRYGQLGASTVTPLRTQGPTATPLSILIASFLAAGWGKVMWSMSANMSPAYREAIVGADAEVANVFKQKFLKSRRVGGAIFILCMLDYLATKTLQEKAFEKVDGLPSTYASVFPSLQASLMTVGTLWAVKTQRFVIVPLIFVAFYNHFDLFRSNVMVDTLLVQPYHTASEGVGPYIKSQAKQLLETV